MRPGETFNPWREACGFFAPDAVMRQRDLKPSAKLLYERLVRYAGRNGHCYPSQAKLADDLGVTDRQIRNDLAVLYKAGLLAHRNRDKRRSNTYEFLWHPCFERNNRSAQTPSTPEFERNNPSGQENIPPDLSGTLVPVNGTPETDSFRSRAEQTGNLSGTVVPTNSVQEFSTENSSSSSTELPTTSSGGFEAGAEPATRTRNRPWWDDPGAMLRAREALRDARAAASWGWSPSLPDSALIRELAPRFDCLNDFLAYAGHAGEHHRREGTKIGGWGFFRADARRWPERRREQPPKASTEPSVPNGGPPHDPAKEANALGQLCAQIKPKIPHQEAYESWFYGLVEESCEGKLLVVRARSEAQTSWLSEEYGHLISQALPEIGLQALRLVSVGVNHAAVHLDAPGSTACLR